jgi:antitoxin VapB
MESITPVYTSAMAFSIKNPEADRLARELAAATGESLTDAVMIALSERLERQRLQRSAGIASRLRRLVEDTKALEVLDPRHPDAIIGYDESGLPR